ARGPALDAVIGRLPVAPNMNALYDGFLDGLQKTADFVEKRLMTGFTRDYIAYMLGFLLVLLGVTAASVGPFSLQTDLSPQGSLVWRLLLLAVLMAAVGLSLPFYRSRVAAVVSMGAVSSGLVILWTLFRVPVLALTLLVVGGVSRLF